MGFEVSNRAKKAGQILADMDAKVRPLQATDFWLVRPYLFAKLLM